MNHLINRFLRNLRMMQRRFEGMNFPPFLKTGLFIALGVLPFAAFVALQSNDPPDIEPAALQQPINTSQRVPLAFPFGEPEAEPETIPEVVEMSPEPEPTPTRSPSRTPSPSPSPKTTARPAASPKASPAAPPVAAPVAPPAEPPPPPPPPSPPPAPVTQCSDGIDNDGDGDIDMDDSRCRRPTDDYEGRPKR